MEQNLQAEIQKVATDDAMMPLEVVSASEAAGTLRDSCDQEAFEQKVARIKEVAARVNANLEKRGV